MRALALGLAAVALLGAEARADYVVRDPTGRRVEIIEEGAGGALVRRTPGGRRLGTMEPTAGGFVLRDERGRRVGAAQGPGRAGRGDAAGAGGLAPGLDTGVVRDRRGRRLGTIQRR